MKYIADGYYSKRKNTVQTILFESESYKYKPLNPQHSFILVILQKKVNAAIIFVNVT